ncbi:MAG: methyl-accepting chemotaxis protein, partial [Planctomycetota bacterium]
KGSVNTEASKAALKDAGADVIIDYNGNPVLSSWTPVKLGDLTWGLLAEVDVSEAFCPKDAKGTFFFEKYIKLYGYYDLFLLNRDGYCFYTVTREADYQTNLVDGKFSSSSLGTAVRKSLDSKGFAFGDFAPYAPSQGVPAAFITQPVMHGGEVELVVGLQLSSESISQLMASGSNKERTLEAYLVGPDYHMRSDSILNPKGYSITASFAEDNTVKTEAVKSALNGDTQSKVITDYLGSRVLSSWAPVKVYGTTWALLSEIDEAVAMAAVKEMIETGDEASATLVTWVLGALILVSILVTALAWGIARSVSNPITRIIASLTAGADQVAAASGQISSASQSLAEGSTEQAASLEETSSALEEMASMTRQNAENAGSANAMMEETGQQVGEGSKAVSNMASAMGEISESSDEIGKIIKTIEEIAFQTNLLALNAAVEAARAGDAGKGFAVVADEVRNLAQRSAEAARNTADLIEGTVTRVKNGTEIVSGLTTSFSAVEESAGRVAGLVAEITTASNEQAQGVDQVNTAVAQMDKVTQQNAANAEESASASEELNAQADQLNAIVAELAALVEGSAAARHGRASAPVGQAASIQPSPRKVAPPPTVGDPNRLIPLDDEDDFKDF